MSFKACSSYCNWMRQCQGILWVWKLLPIFNLQWHWLRSQPGELLAVSRAGKQASAIV